MDDERNLISPAAARVLLIERDSVVLAALSSAVSACLAAVPDLEVAAAGRPGFELLRRSSWDLVAADLDTLCEAASEPAEAIGRLAKLGGSAITMVLAEDSSVSAALAAMRAGAHDYMAKPIEIGAFGRRVSALMVRHGKEFAVGGSGAEPQARPYSGPSLATNRDVPELPQHGRQPTILPMWQQEQRIIEDAIQSFSGNIALAAAALQLSPSTIYRKRQAWADAASGKRGAA